MNIMKSGLLSFVIFSTFCFSVYAEKGYVVMKDGSKQKAVDITSDSKGVLTVAKGPGGKIKTRINPRDYIYVRTVAPSSIKKAVKDFQNKKYSEAASTFKKSYDKYKFLGWDIVCAYRGALAYNALGKTKDAIYMLEKMGGFPVDTGKLNDYMGGMKLLAELYAKSEKYSKAMSALETLSKSNNDSYAAFANNLQGDMLLKQGKRKDAKIMYLKTALLFGKNNTNERPEALFKTIKMLRDEKNNKALEFVKMLKNDYPGSKYIKDL